MSEEISTQVQLQELSPRHKQVVALLVQGVDRHTIAQVCEYTPEYISWLARQSVCQVYFEEMSKFTDARLIALSEKSVDAIVDAMDNGSHENKLRAAKLQLEATGKLGRFKEQSPGAPSNERLAQLGERLIRLLQTNRERVINHEVQTIEG